MMPFKKNLPVAGSGFSDYYVPEEKFLGPPSPKNLATPLLETDIYVPDAKHSFNPPYLRFRNLPKMITVIAQILTLPQVSQVKYKMHCVQNCLV